MPTLVAIKATIAALWASAVSLFHMLVAIGKWLIAKLGPPIDAIRHNINAAELLRVLVLALSAGGVSQALTVLIASLPSIVLSHDTGTSISAAIAIITALLDAWRRWGQGVPIKVRSATPSSAIVISTPSDRTTIVTRDGATEAVIRPMNQ